MESVIGAQFAQLPGYTTAHAGWFWNEHLGRGWTKTAEVPKLADQFELFGDEFKWPTTQFQLQVGAEPNRVQISMENEERMVQIQATRFICNWLRREANYPRYQTLKPEFVERLDSFAAFAKKCGLGELAINQWEMTYVNHLPKGVLWDTPEDWPKIMPGLYAPLHAGDLPLEAASGGWRFVIAGNRGRLSVSQKLAKLKEGGAADVLVLEFTARGPVDRRPGFDLRTGLDVGHDAIVSMFLGMTSSWAQDSWRTSS